MIPSPLSSPASPYQPGKINSQYPNAYYPNEVKPGDILQSNDHLTVYNKAAISQFKGEEFFTDPVAKEANKEKPDGSENTPSKKYSIYSRDKMPYYNNNGPRRPKDDMEDTFKQPNVFAVGIVNADDIENHIQLRKSIYLLYILYIYIMYI